MFYWLSITHNLLFLNQMKKRYILSAIASALIVPGLGQFMNGQVKKAIILMSLVFILFVSGAFQLVGMVLKILRGLNPDVINEKIIAGKLQNMDISALRYILIALMIIWIYSIIDAFISGRKLENEKK